MLVPASSTSLSLSFIQSIPCILSQQLVPLMLVCCENYTYRNLLLISHICLNVVLQISKGNMNVDASMRGSNSQYHRSHSQCSGADMHARLVLENKIIHENILSLQKQALWVYWGIQFQTLQSCFLSGVHIESILHSLTLTLSLLITHYYLHPPASQVTNSFIISHSLTQSQSLTQ